MFNWLRELREILGEQPVCPSCEVLKVELANERREKELLMKHILTPMVEPQVFQDDEPRNPLPLIRQHKPWKVKQQELEMQDRAQKERILQEFKDKVKQASGVNASGVNTEKLENFMGIK